MGPKTLVKIGSLAAEIFLIWTNVARTNVTWTKVTVRLGKKLKIVPVTYLLCLVKFGSVKAEIFIIWTNVARTNGTWTNLILTVGPRNLPLKFGQNRASNS